MCLDGRLFVYKEPLSSGGSCVFRKHAMFLFSDCLHYAIFWQIIPYRLVFVSRSRKTGPVIAVTGPKSRCIAHRQPANCLLKPYW